MSSKTKLRTNPAKKKTKYRDESPLLYFLCSIIWREYCIHYAFFIFIFMPPWWVLRLSSPRSLPAMTFAPGRGWSACGNYELEPISSLPEQNKKIISLIISGLITLDFGNCSQILLFILLGYWLLGMIWKSNKFTCKKGTTTLSVTSSNNIPQVPRWNLAYIYCYLCGSNILWIKCTFLCISAINWSQRFESK